MRRARRVASASCTTALLCSAYHASVALDNNDDDDDGDDDDDDDGDVSSRTCLCDKERRNTRCGISGEECLLSILPPHSQALPRRPPRDVTPRPRAGSFRARAAAFLVLRTRRTRVDRAVPVGSGATQSCNVGPRVNVRDCDDESTRSPTAGPTAHGGSYDGGARRVHAYPSSPAHLVDRPERTEPVTPCYTIISDHGDIRPWWPANGLATRSRALCRRPIPVPPPPLLPRTRGQRLRGSSSRRRTS